MKQFQPIHDRICIKPTAPDNFVAGIELFGADIQEKAEGTVVSVGQGVPLHEINLKVLGDATLETMSRVEEVVRLIENGRKMRVKVGDYVIYGKYAGTKIKLDGEDHIIVREADVFGILTE